MLEYKSVALVGALLGCGVVGHQENQVPLHRLEYVQDPVEELERKWSFEVRWGCFFTSFCRVLFRDCKD